MCKFYTIRVRICEECPSAAIAADIDGEVYLKCSMVTGRDNSIVDGSHIPDWCPLEDA